MLRLAHALLLCVALAAFVAAGPTVRKDELSNAITAPPEPEAEAQPPASEEPAAVPTPVKLPASNDEPANESTTGASTTVSSAKPTEDDSTSAPSSTTAVPPTPSPSTTPTSTTKAPGTSAISGSTSVPPSKPPRKTITFDQRQEGKYNIRADLENFVIVVVPSGSSSGASLLDLLTRSAHKNGGAHQTRKASHHKRKNHKVQSAQKKVAQATPEVIVLDENHQRSGQLETEEFIEGRTPYKVDLSSSARSVDGAETADPEVPPVAGKPSFTFSVEPSVSSSRLVRFPSGNYPPSAPRAAEGRALRVDGYPNTNMLAEATGSSSSSSNRLSSTSATTNNRNLPGDGEDVLQRTNGHSNSLLVLRRSGDAGRDAAPGDRDGASGLHSYPATVLLVDPHHSYHAPSSFDSLEYEPLRSDVDMTQLQLEPDSTEYRYDDLVPTGYDAAGGLTGDWDELRLLGAQEQCGPDRKRDSYGVCQFVQP